MYCERADSAARRSAQTAMWRILDSLVLLLGPILAHTAEEAWAAMEHKSQDVESVHLALLPKVDAGIDFAAEAGKWRRLMAIRDEVLRVLEGLRRDKKIASNQEASVTVCCGDEDAELLRAFGLEQFATLCIVSEVSVQPAVGDLSVAAKKSEHGKCERCWNYWASVGANAERPELCTRCVSVVNREA